MEVQVKYSDLEDRQIKVAENEAKGLRMLHDDFDPDWQASDEPHGTMTFTDKPSPVEPVKPIRDLLTELDALKAEVEKLKKK